MTFLLLRRGADLSAYSDDPIVASGDVPALRSAAELLGQAESEREQARRDAEQLRQRAEQAGYEDGRKSGGERAAADYSSRLFELEVKAAKARDEQRAEAIRLALEIVRRIAAELGPEAMIAGLAERAAQDLAPDTPAIMKVAPSARASVATRLDGRDALTILADPALADNDCIVETRFGVVHAGLETQLAAIERTWRQAEQAG